MPLDLSPTAPAPAPAPQLQRPIRPLTLGALLLLSVDLQEEGEIELAIQKLQAEDLSGAVQTPGTSIPPHA